MLKKVYYGWIVVAVASLTILVAAGLRAAPGVFLLPAEVALRVDRATIAAVASIGLLMYGIAAPLSGWMLTRMGVRKVAAIGLGLAAVGMIPTMWVTEVWQLVLLWGIIGGLGTGIVGGVVGAALAARWFVARRGLVTGIVGAATSAGQLVFVPMLMTASSSIGWRTASLWLGVIAVLVAIPAVWLLRDDPAQKGLLPYGATPDTPIAAPPKVDATRVMAEAVRTPTFWLLSSSFFICGATSTGLIGTHLIPFAVECGIPAGIAASSLALMGAMNFVGTLGSGILTDRFDPRKLLLIFYGFRGLSLLFLPLVSTGLGLTFFAVLFGLDYIATVPPTISIIADRFGRARVGVIYGWVLLAHSVGAALAAWLGGVARDAQGNYSLAFLAAGALAISAGFIALSIREKPAIEPLPATA